MKDNQNFVKSFIDALESKPDIAKVERKITPETIISGEYHFNVLINPKIRFINVNISIEAPDA